MTLPPTGAASHETQPRRHGVEPAAQLRARLDALKAAQRVRLDEEEIEGLAYALEGVPARRICLFGSRVQPDRRGGDIDLLIFTDTQTFTLAQEVALRFFSRCEEKIDIVVMDPERLTPEQADFLARITAIDIAP